MDARNLDLRTLRHEIRSNRISFPSQPLVFVGNLRSWHMTQLFISGWSMKQIAKRYGLSTTRVDQLICRWRRFAVAKGFLQYIDPMEDLIRDFAPRLPGSEVSEVLEVSLREVHSGIASDPNLVEETSETSETP